MTTKGSTTTAFMIGALAGGVAALLLAPQTGEQLRRRLEENGAEELQTAGDKLKHNARDKAESVTGAVKSAVTEAKSTYRDELDRRRHNETVETIARKTGA